MIQSWNLLSQSFEAHSNFLLTQIKHKLTLNYKVIFKFADFLACVFNEKLFHFSYQTFNKFSVLKAFETNQKWETWQ